VINNRDRVRIRTEMAKAKSFASRSEAGRYAANMRWKGQGENTPTASTGGKTPKQKYDFSPQDYKMVREAMPQLSAADAKKLTQYLLDHNAFGDTSEMSLQEMSNEFALYLNDALGGGSSSAKTPQSSNGLRVKQVQYPGINSSRDEVSEETYEQAEMQIEGFLYQLKEVGTEILGKESFERQFGKEVASIKDNMRDGRYRSSRFIPHAEAERAGKLQDQLAEAVSKI
jgi:hypothetical protein